MLMVENFLLIKNYYQYVYMVLYYNQFEHHGHLIYVSKYRKILIRFFLLLLNSYGLISIIDIFFSVLNRI
jgi:hypothetical protein